MGLFSAGCPWSPLDDLAKQAPVQVLERADSFTSASFGLRLVSLERRTEEQRPTLVLGGQYRTPVAVVEWSSSGSVSRTRVASVPMEQIVDIGDRMGNTIQSIIELAPAGSTRRVLIGVPEEEYVRWVEIPEEAEIVVGGMFAVSTGVALSHFGGALAAGNLTGDAELQEWAIAEDDAIFIMLDESEGVDFEVCDVPGPGQSGFESTSRSLAAGRFFGENGGVGFAAGLPSPDSPSYGVVRLIRWSGSLDCSAQVITAPPGREEHYFGRSVFAVDLDGKDGDDLIVGSPNLDDSEADSRVYVYMSRNGSLMSTPSYAAVSTGRAFGQTVSAMDLDGDDIPELIVGDPQTMFNDGSNRGQVHIFHLETLWTADASSVRQLEADVETIIGDTAEPGSVMGAEVKKATSSFGTALAGLNWDRSNVRQELVVGLSEAVYVFFLTGLENDSIREDPDHDPR